MPNQDSILLAAVTSLKGVGPSVAEKLANLHLHTIQDVLFHLPTRYQDRTRVLPIGSLQAGMECVVEADIQHAEIKFGRRRMLLVRIADGTGPLLLRFFHFNRSQQERLQAGDRIRCFGEVRKGAATLEMVHPEYKILGSEEISAVEETLTPIYRATDGVHQATLRKLTDQALLSAHQVKELIPAEYCPDQYQYRLIDALQMVHRPPPDADVSQLTSGIHPAQQRLAFEELLAQLLSLKKLRQRISLNPSFPMTANASLRGKFLEQLPFTLTAAQQRVVEEISSDLQQNTPMMRLLQGDVGSGKTVVAALACLQAIEAGYQTAVMAPTEILAEQHYQNFRDWFEPLGIKISWHTGKLKAAQRREMQELISSGESQLAIGTHALFQTDIAFKNLGLFVIDEQHRFGVQQRMALQQKGERDGHLPHQLIMTATPIPRTLAMTAYVDLDLSIIDELPPGRKPVTTTVLSVERRDQVIERVAQACSEGQQCYWVCTLIEESEMLQCQAAEEAFEYLQQTLHDLNVGLIHGRMKPTEKEQIMSDFKAAELDLLVATTVIEVGVDVPNASLMVIENAERLGLSQLHQLRGRVGRGSTASHCLLIYKAPLSANGKERLAAMRETNDGFKIAQIDLELRGPGEFLGTRQTGLVEFKIADLLRDKGLIPEVQSVSEVLLERYPTQVDAIITRWHGEKLVYQQV